MKVWQERNLQTAKMASEGDLYFANETVDTNSTFVGIDDGNATFGNDTDGGNATDIVVKSSLNFVDSFAKSFSVMIVSELGDKTFFLAGEENVGSFENVMFDRFWRQNASLAALVPAESC